MLHDIGCQDGVDYLVMEYLEGETLEQRLNRGPLPTDQVLKYGIEIADALEKAHRHNVVHRDLKPGNIMLTKSGSKLLDFGLARLMTQPLPVTNALSQLATQTRENSLTEEGVILGTFQYMAPEQLEGKEADARTDLFALGAVLYEMTTGRPAFVGKSRASLIAAVLSSEPPPISTSQPLTPPAMDRAVKICLAKDPDERFQSAHDLKLQLEWIKEGGSQAGIPRVTATRRINRERIAWATTAFLLLALAAIFGMRYLQIPPEPPTKVIFAVEPPLGYKIADDTALALSQNGSQIAYVARDAKGKTSLWVRSLGSLASRRLEGSESDSEQYSLVWTADGNAVIAAVNRKLVRFSVIGGANEVLCDSFEGEPSTVNAQGTILVWTPPPTKVFSISPEDCTPRPRSPSGGPGAGVGYAYPHFLPDGNYFLFAAIRKDKHHDVLLGSLDSTTTRLVIRNGSHPKYIASGYILFSRDGYLMAQKFNAKSQRSSGEPFLVHPNQLNFYAAFGWAAFDASRNGLISAREQAAIPSILRWYSRSGKVLQTIGEPEFRVMPRLTTNGTYVAVVVWEPRTHAMDVWSLDLERGTRTRESFQERPGSGWMAWSPNGERIVYSALIGSRVEMFLKNAGSNGNGQLLQTGLQGSKLVGDFSPDGNSIAYLFEPDAGDDEPGVYGQSLAGGKPFLLARAGPEEEPPRLSHDGRWVAYVSGESGSSEIYVRPFTPGGAASTQVSFGGGHDPRWSLDSKELLYRTNDWHIAAIPVIDLTKPRFGKPETLFRLAENAEYDTVDGKRFLVNEPAGEASAPLFVIVNWKPEIAKSE
jgi:Tol biopolymer transport system component